MNDIVEKIFGFIGRYFNLLESREERFERMDRHNMGAGNDLKGACANLCKPKPEGAKAGDTAEEVDEFATTTSKPKPEKGKIPTFAPGVLNPYLIVEKQRYSGKDTEAMRAELERIGFDLPKQANGEQLRATLQKYAAELKAVEVPKIEVPEKDPVVKANDDNIFGNTGAEAEEYSLERVQGAFRKYVTANSTDKGMLMLWDIVDPKIKPKEVFTQIPEDKYKDLIIACTKGYVVDADGLVILGK